MRTDVQMPIHRNFKIIFTEPRPWHMRGTTDLFCYSSWFHHILLHTQSLISHHALLTVIQGSTDISTVLSWKIYQVRKWLSNHSTIHVHSANQCLHHFGWLLIYVGKNESTQNTHSLDMLYLCKTGFPVFISKGSPQCSSFLPGQAHGAAAGNNSFLAFSRTTLKPGTLASTKA